MRTSDVPEGMLNKRKVSSAKVKSSKPKSADVGRRSKRGR
jgi:hypothetical protein